MLVSARAAARRCSIRATMTLATMVPTMAHAPRRCQRSHLRHLRLRRERPACRDRGRTIANRLFGVAPGAPTSRPTQTVHGPMISPPPRPAEAATLARRQCRWCPPYGRLHQPRLPNQSRHRHLRRLQPLRPPTIRSRKCTPTPCRPVRTPHRRRRAHRLGINPTAPQPPCTICPRRSLPGRPRVRCLPRRPAALGPCQPRNGPPSRSVSANPLNEPEQAVGHV